MTSRSTSARNARGRSSGRSPRRPFSSRARAGMSTTTRRRAVRRLPTLRLRPPRPKPKSPLPRARALPARRPLLRPLRPPARRRAPRPDSLRHRAESEWCRPRICENHPVHAPVKSPAPQPTRIERLAFAGNFRSAAQNRTIGASTGLCTKNTSMTKSIPAASFRAPRQQRRVRAASPKNCCAPPPKYFSFPQIFLQAIFSRQKMRMRKAARPEYRYACSRSSAFAGHQPSHRRPAIAGNRQPTAKD